MGWQHSILPCLARLASDPVSLPWPTAPGPAGLQRCRRIDGLRDVAAARARHLPAGSQVFNGAAQARRRLLQHRWAAAGAAGLCEAPIQKHTYRAAWLCHSALLPCQMPWRLLPLRHPLLFYAGSYTVQVNQTEICKCTLADTGECEDLRPGVANCTIERAAPLLLQRWTPKTTAARRSSLGVDPRAHPLCCAPSHLCGGLCCRAAPGASCIPPPLAPPPAPAYSSRLFFDALLYHPFVAHAFLQQHAESTGGEARLATHLQWIRAGSQGGRERRVGGPGGQGNARLLVGSREQGGEGAVVRS